MHAIAFQLLMTLGVAYATTTGDRALAFDYRGTAMAACDVNDGPASEIVLEPAAPSDGRLHILVHDATPPALQGHIPISDAGYAKASASLIHCEGRRDADCRSAIEGGIVIDSRTGSVLQGHLRYRLADGPWHAGTFRAVVAKPPRPLLCG